MGKVNQIKADDEQYGFKPLSSKAPQDRLDLNNLLNRIKEEKKKSRKTNLFIFSGATVIVVVFVTLLSF